MKRLIKLMSVAIVATGLLVGNVYAANLWCTGKVSNVWVTYSSNLMIYSNWRNQHTMVCNLRYEWKGIPIETCKEWSAMLNAAKLAQENLTVYYHNVEAESCAELPIYSGAPSPYYVMTR